MTERFFMLAGIDGSPAIARRGDTASLPPRVVAVFASTEEGHAAAEATLRRLNGWVNRDEFSGAAYEHALHMAKALKEV